MLKKLSAIVVAVTLCLSIVCVGFAEETDNAENDSPFDYTAEQQQIEELGIPTVTSVAKLKKEADDLWDRKDYKAAAAAYAIYAKQANWLANIISAGLEPFYGASYDDRESFSPYRFSLSSLASAENKANSYKTERNRAMLYEGLCYYNLNDYETALPLLVKALNYIEIDDERNWKIGMDALYSIVGLVDYKDLSADKLATPTPRPTPTPTPENAKTATVNCTFFGGMSGDVIVTVTENEDGSIATLTVDASSQTPTLGGKCAEEAFTSQFIGKKAPFTLNQDGVDQISGATVTSQAVVDAINSLYP